MKSDVEEEDAEGGGVEGEREREGGGIELGGGTFHNPLLVYFYCLLVYDNINKHSNKPR